MLEAASAVFTVLPRLAPGRYITSVSLKKTLDRIGIDPVTKSVLSERWAVWPVEGNR